MSDVKEAPAPTLPGSERSDYRGKCLYKTGKCMNERALKTSGAAHNLCDAHRYRQNEHQRKLDAKNRLHKRERRSTKGERFSPYQSASARRQSREPPGNTSGDTAESLEAPVAPPTAATTTTVEVDEETTSSPSVAPTPMLSTTGSDAMFLPNGQQLTYPLVMQDFDGIVVPLPSYLEGQERVEFRSRIYQKVLDFISEECIARFGAKAEPADDAAVPGATDTTQTSSSGLHEAEHAARSEDDASEERLANDTSPDPSPVAEGARPTSSTTKRVH